MDEGFEIEEILPALIVLPEKFSGEANLLLSDTVRVDVCFCIFTESNLPLGTFYYNSSELPLTVLPKRVFAMF